MADTVHLVPADDSQITAWALAAGRGDRQATVAFIRATQTETWRFLAHLIGPGEADDLAQETYLRALRALPRFAGRSQARTWLLAIARRVAVDHIRAAVSRPRIAATDDWQGLAERAIPASRTSIDDAVSINLAVAALPADRREAFVLTQLIGLAYTEAAQVCGCPVGTIRSRVARARQDLVRALRDDRTGQRAG